MKKKISNSLFLLALCMQYNTGKVVAEQATIKEAYIPMLDVNNLTGRLLKVHAKLQPSSLPGLIKNKSSGLLNDKKLNQIYETLQEISVFLQDRDRRTFRRKPAPQKVQHVSGNMLNVIESLSHTQQYKPLNDEEKKVISRHIATIEDAANVKK